MWGNRQRRPDGFFRSSTIKNPYGPCDVKEALLMENLNRLGSDHRVTKVTERRLADCLKTHGVERALSDCRAVSMSCILLEAGYKKCLKEKGGWQWRCKHERQRLDRCLERENK